MDQPQRMPAGVIRLTEDDAGELLTLQLAAWVREMHHNPGVRIPPLHENLDDVRAQLCDPAQTIWGLRRAGRLIATVRTSIGTSDTAVALLARLAVVPDLTRQGLGGAMLHHAEAHLLYTVRRIELVTGARSFDNHRFYARHGYAIAGPGPAQGTLLLAKSLGSATDAASAATRLT